MVQGERSNAAEIRNLAREYVDTGRAGLSSSGYTGGVDAMSELLINLAEEKGLESTGVADRVKLSSSAHLRIVPDEHIFDDGQRGVILSLTIEDGDGDKAYDDHGPLPEYDLMNALLNISENMDRSASEKESKIDVNNEMKQQLLDRLNSFRDEDKSDS
jgi:hypothetical protein